MTVVERVRTRLDDLTAAWETISPAQRRVAVLIAEGCTNRGAAERLFLSHNTVGTHVRAVYEKLGVHSRVELALALSYMRIL